MRATGNCALVLVLAACGGSPSTDNKRVEPRPSPPSSAAAPAAPAAPAKPAPSAKADPEFEVIMRPRTGPLEGSAPPPDPPAVDRPRTKSAKKGAVKSRPPSKTASIEPATPPTVSNVVRVYYATDRCKTGRPEPGRHYGRCLAPGTEYGVAQVTFPESHKPGHIERPLDLWIVSLPEREDRHVILRRVTALAKDEFFGSMGTAVASTRTKSAFVFVHGFNNTFQEAAWRAAQISRDVELDMVPVLYSWPSKESAAEYMADAQFAEIVWPRLQVFLQDVATRSGAQTIHLIAHSMGSRLVSRALTEMIREGGAVAQFRHLVLGAPDINAVVFNQQIAPYFRDSGLSVSIYASSTDKALKLSQELQAQFPRLGQVRGSLDVPSFIDVIDATVVDDSLLGHAYLFESKALLGDLFPLLHDGKRASDRTGLRKGAGGYWLLAP